MTLFEMLERINLPSHVLDVENLLVPVPFENNLIHLDYFCIPAYNTEEYAYYDKVFSSFSSLTFSSLPTSLVKAVSLRSLMENRSLYCPHCVEQIDTFTVNGQNLSTYLLKPFLRDIENVQDFLKADSFYLYEIFDILDAFRKRHVSSELNTLFLSMQENVTEKLKKRLDEDTVTSKDFREELLRLTLKGTRKSFLSSTTDPLHALTKDFNESLTKILVETEGYVIFNSNRVSFQKMADDYEAEAFARIFVHSLKGNLDAFSVLPYLEFKFLEACCFDEYDKDMRTLSVYTKEFPSVEVLETCKGLYDAGNETLSSYANVLEAAKII